MHRLIEYLDHQALDDTVNILLVDEAHFQVDLRELRLTVFSQVLVAETPGDLEIPVKTRHHQKLLVYLRRLGQRIELPEESPRGNKKIARTLWCAPHEKGSFNFNKLFAPEIITCYLSHF